MSAVKGGVYQRGQYWLDYARGADSQPVSDRWYIWWYDPATGHQKRRSTRTSDVRAACDKLDELFLSTHTPTAADRAAYSVADAMMDYFIEHGQHLPSAAAVRSRMGLFDRFRQAEQEAGRMPSPLMAEHIDDLMLNRFRKWGVHEDLIVARKKDADGNWIAGESRKRTASTVEESIIQLKAALNHAFRSRRLTYVPPIRHRTREQVTPQRTYRLSLEGVGELLDYSFRGNSEYEGHGDKLLPLRRYLIGAICTLGRPDAIIDMNVLPGREQWLAREGRFNLNYAGRVQTKKVRPTLPVVSLLHTWLSATDEWFVCGERTKFDEDQRIDVTTQYRVMSVRKAWDGARKELRIPAGWGPKLIRHSMATILANRGVDLVQLEMALGHRVLGKTSSTYALFAPDYLSSIKSGLEDVIADLTKQVGPALHPKLHPTFTQKESNIAVLRA